MATSAVNEYGLKTVQKESLPTVWIHFLFFQWWEFSLTSKSDNFLHLIFIIHLLKNIVVLCREITFWSFIRVYYLHPLVILWFSGKKLLSREALGEGGDCGDPGDGTDRGESGEWTAGDSVVSGRALSPSSGLTGCGGSISLASIRGGRGSGLISSKGTSASGLASSEYPYIAINSARGMSCS